MNNLENDVNEIKDDLTSIKVRINYIMELIEELKQLCAH